MPASGLIRRATGAGETLVHRIRFRVLAFVLGLALAGFGAISWAALPALPVIGVAVATAAVVVRSMTSPLTSSACRGCGVDLAALPAGEHGVSCPACGRVNTTLPSAPLVTR